MPYVVASPNGVEVAPAADQPFAGNFTWTDDFAAAELSPLWLMLRTPKIDWWQISEGSLRLTPQTELFSGTGNPSYLGRRIQHSKFETSARLKVPTAPGTSAGLAVMQDETHHYYWGARRTATALHAFVELQNGGEVALLASHPLPAATETITLRLTGDGPTLAFAYALGDDDWLPLLPAAPSYPISVQAAGGGLHFTGTLIGPHARIDPTVAALAK